MKGYYRKVECKKLPKGISYRAYFISQKSCACVKKHLQRGKISRRLKGME